MTRFHGPRGKDLVSSVTRRAEILSSDGEAEEALFPDTGPFRVYRLTLERPGSCLTSDSSAGAHCLVAVSGRFTIHRGEARPVELRYGMSAVIPAAMGVYRIEASIPGEIVKVLV